MRRQRARHHVGGVGMRALVGRRSHPAFGIGLDHDAAQIGHARCRAGPPSPSTMRRPRDRAGRTSPACRGSADCRNRPRPRYARPTDAAPPRSAPPPAGYSGEITRRSAFTLLIEQPLMPTEASSRPYSLTRVRSVAHVPALPEHRAPAVAALDRAVQVVPLIHPAHRRVGRLLLVELRDRFPGRRSCAAARTRRKRAAIVAARRSPGTAPRPRARSSARTRRAPAYASSASCGASLRRSSSVPARIALSAGSAVLQPRACVPACPRTPRSNSARALPIDAAIRQRCDQHRGQRCALAASSTGA